MKFNTLAIVFFSFILLNLSSCDSCSNQKQPAGTHTHDDGAVHENHADEAKKSTEQESFKVDADSTTQPAAKKHDHDHGHDHSDPNHKH